MVQTRPCIAHAGLVPHSINRAFMIPWQLITFFGDSVITMPAAAAIAIWLVTAGAWRMALTWSLLFGVALTLVTATKVAFIGWGIGIPGLDFTGISGHAMRACAVLPVVVYLLLQPAGRKLRLVGTLLGAGAGVMIALSRIVLNYHSASEVVIGIGLGTLVAIAFIRRSEDQSGFRLQRWIVGLTLLGLVPTTYAQPAPTHQWVTTVALYLSGSDRPYIRDSRGELARGPAITRQH